MDGCWCCDEEENFWENNNEGCCEICGDRVGEYNLGCCANCDIEKMCDECCYGDYCANCVPERVWYAPIENEIYIDKEGFTKPEIILLGNLEE